jgi:hypothetical protein
MVETPQKYDDRPHTAGPQCPSPSTRSRDKISDVLALEENVELTPTETEHILTKGGTRCHVPILSTLCILSGHSAPMLFEPTSEAARRKMSHRRRKRIDGCKMNIELNKSCCVDAELMSIHGDDDGKSRPASRGGDAMIGDALREEVCLTGEYVHPRAG